MFNYLFPIFCFGLVMSGIVLLGLLEASKQVKAQSKKDQQPATRDDVFNKPSSSNSHSQRFAPRGSHD
ncbi:MAG: hypothetical protein FJ404_11380 [Verrucomicrobia bacterium]|nr:hypothetical protein [Verrucomicrobiota bacterium]